MNGFTLIHRVALVVLLAAAASTSMGCAAEATSSDVESNDERANDGAAQKTDLAATEVVERTNADIGVPSEAETNPASRVTKYGEDRLGPHPVPWQELRHPSDPDESTPGVVPPSR